MKDLVSRQAVIEAIEKTDWYHINKNGELVQGATSDMEALYKADDIYRAMAELGTEGAWIPSSVLMPPLDEEVFAYLFEDSAYIVWWDGYAWNTEDFKVDAEYAPKWWTPLPDPIREENEMKNWEPKDTHEKILTLAEYKSGKELPAEKLMWIAKFYEQAYRIERDKE